MSEENVARALDLVLSGKVALFSTTLEATAAVLGYIEIMMDREAVVSQDTDGFVLGEYDFVCVDKKDPSYIYCPVRVVPMSRHPETGDDCQYACFLEDGESQDGEWVSSGEWQSLTRTD